MKILNHIVVLLIEVAIAFCLAAVTYYMTILSTNKFITTYLGGAISIVCFMICSKALRKIRL